MSEICQIQQAFLNAVKDIKGAENMDLRTNHDVSCSNEKLYSVWLDVADDRPHDTIVYTRKEPTADHSLAVTHLEHALTGAKDIKEQRSFGDEGAQHATVAPRSMLYTV